MANQFFNFTSTVVAGSTIRSDHYNSGQQAIEAAFDSVEQEFSRAVSLPDNFGGSNLIPEQSVEDTFLYINSEGNLSLYSGVELQSQFSLAASSSLAAASDAAQVAIHATEVSNDASQVSLKLGQTETARNEAETAKNEAETAKNEAETARSGANNAKDAAITAKNSSVDAKNEAENAETAAVNAENASQSAMTDAVTARGGAENAETAAVNARTGAETAQTGAVAAKDAANVSNGLAEDAKEGAEDARDSTQALLDSIVDPSDFGLGGNADQITDFDEAAGTPRGSEFLAAHPVNTANKPTGAGTNNYAGIRCKRLDSSYFEFWAGLSENRYWARAYNVGYKDWVEMYTSGNSVNPLDFGLGGDAVNAGLTDWDDVTSLTSGNYTQFQSTSTSILNSPPFVSNTSINSAFSVVATNGRKTLVLTELKRSAGIRFERTETSAGVWSDWHTVYNSGNSVNPLDFGIGNAGPSVTDANGPLANGLYSGVGSTALNYPSNMEFGNFLNMVRANNGAIHSRLYMGRAGGITSVFASQSTDSGATFNHAELFHSANSVNAKDFGLGPRTGITDLANASLDTITATGFFTGYGGLHSTASTGDNPFSDGGGAFSLLSQKCVNTTDSEFTTQTAIAISLGETTSKIRSKSSTSNGWGPWIEILHSGNSVNPLDFGIGGIPNSVVSADDAVGSGVFMEDNDVNIFNARTPILNVARTTSKTGWQLACETGGSTGSNTVKLLARATSSTAEDYGDAVEILHTGKVNSDVFGGTGSGKVLAVGFARDATSAYFPLHINSPLSKKAQTITVLNDFLIRSVDGGTVKGNVTGTDIILDRASSRVAMLRISNLTGLTAGENLIFVTLNNTSKITVGY